MSRRGAAALGAAALALLTACSLPGTGTTGERTPGPEPSQGVDPRTPSGWGPTVGELQEAADLVATWTPEQLAGQVIVGRYHSVDPQDAARLVSDLHLAGVSVTAENVVDAEQVRATTAAVHAAVAEDGRDHPAVVGVDEEGGSVAHLRGVATTYPAFSAAGRVVEQAGAEGRTVVREATRASGLQLRDLGFSWVFAPVADVTIGSADPTIGSRSPSSDPQVAAAATSSAVRGYNDAGIVSTTKHFPGHGSATADSHLVLPRLDRGLDELRTTDLVPFRRAVRAGAPAVMMSHLDVQALEPGVPATLAPRVHDFLREDLGFEGVVITDSLGMGAVVAQRTPAVRALLAGADLLLMPADTRRTHATVSAAIASGEIPRERAEEAAARVVALQRWQQRVAGDVPVPEDVTSMAETAAARLAAG